MKIPAFLIFNLSLAALALGGEPGAKPAAAGPGFELTGMKCFSDKYANKAEIGKDGFKIEAGWQIGSAGPGSEISDFTFPEDQKKQYFEFQFGPGAGDKLITVVVKSAKTTLGAGVKVVSVSGKTDGEGKLPGEWSLKKNWPVGVYKVYFTYEDQPVGTATYLVKALKDRESPIKAKGVTIFSFKDGKAVEKTELTSEDNDLVFKCETEGAYTKGAKVRMFIGMTDEKGEKEIFPKSEVTEEDWPLEDTELIYSFELPKKFPPGEYHAVFFVNDELLVAHPFTVKE